MCRAVPPLPHVFMMWPAKQSKIYTFIFQHNQFPTLEQNCVCVPSNCRLSSSVHRFAADSSSRLANVRLRISCGVRCNSNSLSRVSLISTAVMENIPSSANVEIRLTVFRSWIPDKKIISPIRCWSFITSAVGVWRTKYWGQGVIRCKREDKTAEWR